ncbi:type IX secretion system membrane protein PorP/SprF [Aequorivita sp. SDUM287046]|uniref:Type IX secretion system membrane protein PorP/SprF n=1 Tax=Aequorivita aurantiaca TaxID=3053356 RepID=A0ABT8DJS4_9FLAO|nr:type IX secretion system membrane protein PorP/SprF [Aequorivita aurantiaca]MDN3725084.1 type IX secretion system membrane protein PorP/SprF [Aequorivita aurantiaca]
MKIKIQLLSFLLLVCLLSVGFKAFAQQESQFTQYMYNTSSINPAYAGSRGSLSMLGLYRAQWVGLDGAPETLNFAAHTPLGSQGIGLGIGFMSDKIGASSENIITADVSYTITFAENVKLAFGIKGGLSLLDIDPSKLTAYNPNDYDLAKKGYASPMIGGGLYLYSDKWYLGLSTPNFLETEFYDEVKVSTATEKAHFYMLGGYVFAINDNLKLKPSAMIKGVVGAPMAFDVSANALIYNKVNFGLAYRFDAAVSALAGFRVTDQIMIGYAYDYSTSELQDFNNGSHEIFLRFEVGSLYSAKMSPRFF